MIVHSVSTRMKIEDHRSRANFQGHEEQEDHSLKKTVEVTFICKKCKKAFRKVGIQVSLKVIFPPFLSPDVNIVRTCRNSTKPIASAHIATMNS